MLKIRGWLSLHTQKPWIQRAECRTWVCADLVPEAGPGTSPLRIQWWVCCINTVGAYVINARLSLVSQTENPYANAPDQEAEFSRIPVFSFETPPSYHPLPGDKLYFFHKNVIYLPTRVDCYFLLQGIFPTRELIQGLPHRRCILHKLSYQGSPRKLNVPCKNNIQYIEHIYILIKKVAWDYGRDR